MLNKFLSLLLVLFFTNGLFGQSFYLQLNKCWELSREDILNDRIASDNDILIIPTINSSIYSINLKNNLLWSNEFNGDLISEIIIIENNFFYISKNFKTNAFQLNSLSKETGLINWTKGIFTNKQKNEIKLFNSKGKLGVISDNIDLIFLNPNNGENIKEITLPEFPSSNIILLDNEIYYINNRSQLIKYNFESNQKEIIITTKSTENILFLVNESEFLLTDNKGQVMKVDINNKKKFWSVRTGGQVTSALRIAEDYLVSSLDNYLYLINSKNGKLKWRKRLNGRTIGEFQKSNNLYLSPIINSNLAIFSEINKGKTINQINLSEDNFFTGKPFIINENIIVPTSKGLLNYKFGKC